MELTPDSSFFLQILLFFVLWAVLNRLGFAPMRKVLEVRAERTVAAEEQAQHLRAAAEAGRNEYEKSLHALRVEMTGAATAARTAAQEEQLRALAAARTAAGEDLARLRDSLSAAVEAARRTLAADAGAIAAEMLARVSRRVRA
jgi:F0F1-type ATP synthase membrane subunit b/b'